MCFHNSVVEFRVHLTLVWRIQKDYIKFRQFQNLHQFIDPKIMELCWATHYLFLFFCWNKLENGQNQTTDIMCYLLEIISEPWCSIEIPCWLLENISYENHNFPCFAVTKSDIISWRLSFGLSKSLQMSSSFSFCILQPCNVCGDGFFILNYAKTIHGTSMMRPNDFECWMWNQSIQKETALWGERVDPCNERQLLAAGILNRHSIIEYEGNQGEKRTTTNK